MGDLIEIYVKALSLRTGFSNGDKNFFDIYSQSVILKGNRRFSQLVESNAPCNA